MRSPGRSRAAAGSTSSTPRPETRGSPRSRRCHPARADDHGVARPARGASFESTSSSSGPRRRSSPGSPTSCATAASPSSARARRRRRSRARRAFAKDVMEAAGVPTARTLAGRAAAVRRQGRRPRRGQGRLGLPDAGGARRGAARGGGARPAVPRRGAARRRGGLDLRVVRRRERPRRCPPRRTTSASATTTRAPNTGGMGSYSPVPRLSDDEVAELVELTCTPVLARARAAADARSSARSSPG